MDLSLFESGDGGDVIFTGGDLQITDALWNQIYMALFGGNVEQTTEEAEQTSDAIVIQRFDWWGNTAFFFDKPQNQFNSRTERDLFETAITSEGRIKLEATIKKDLEFMSELAEIDVSITLTNNDRIKINIGFQENDGIEERLVFLWDGTQIEEIIERTISGGGTVQVELLITQAGDSIVTQDDEFIET